MRFTTLRLPLFLTVASLVGAPLTPRALAVDLLSENFDQLPLGQVVTFQSEVRHRAAWTAAVPSGAGVEGLWSVDNTLMPASSQSNLVGVAEFEGWTFVNRDWWIDTAGDQERRLFVSASGTIAIADADEWDDFGAPTANNQRFDSTLRISSIPLQGIAANTARLFFHSSWRWEDTQKASLTVKYNDLGATTIELFRWTSDEADPNFKDDAINEAINIPILNPAGATQATLEFRMFDAGNDWWWAVDNINMFTGAAPAVDGALRLIINRDTREVKIVNNTPGPINLRGYAIESSFGTLDETTAVFLGDTNSNWQTFDNPNVSELSEGFIPDQYVMPTLSSNPTLGQINFGTPWRKYHEDIDDISFQYLVAGSNTPKVGIIEFTGNNGESYDLLDLNFDGEIGLPDYAAFLAGYNTSLAGKTAAQRHNLGDLDADQKHTVRDFQQFQALFDEALGPGAFAAMLAVPEPAALTLLSAAILGGLGLLRRPRQLAALLTCVVALAVAPSAHANFPLLLEDFDDLPLGASPEEDPTQLNVWNGVGPAGWTIDDSGMPGLGNPTTDGITDWAGWAFVKKDFWLSADLQNREFFTKGTGNVMVADPDEWQDGAVSPIQLFDAFVTTRTINIPAGTPANKVRLAFDSSWRPEGADEGIPEINNTNDQTATINVSYNGGAKTNVLTWTSLAASPTFKPDAENESVDINLGFNGNSGQAATLKVEFGLGKAWNDWWWAVDNIRVYIQANPSVLRVNTSTGVASIIGGDVISTSITGFDVFSANGNLAPTGNIGLSFSKPDSIDSPRDADAIVGNNINETWQLGAANANQFAEFFLDGSSAFTESRTEPLGQIFNPATLPANRDLQFTYTTIFGDVITGLVDYVSTPANANFDSDSDVDGVDFLRWQRGFGGPGALAQGDADADGDVDGADLTIWRTQFGAQLVQPAVQPVPEPSTAWLAGAMAAVAASASRRFRRRAATRAVVAAVGVAAICSIAQRAQAQAIPAPWVDRNYRFGDTDPGAVANGFVSTTRDSAGLPNMNQLIHLVGVAGSGGLPRYVTISGRPDGGTGLGIRVNNAASDALYLKTGFDEALNFPERSPSSTESTLGGTLQGTLDYQFITDRGFQLWVQPFATTEAHIVMDTNNHGALITATGKFGMRYSKFDYVGKTTVVPNTWYHLMVIRPRGPNNGSILYVNGVAEAAAVGIYSGENAPNDEVNPVNHDNGPLVIGSTASESEFEVGAGKFFRGIVDDLEMFVMGLNQTSDRGEFEFQRDNDYAAHFGPTTAGDVNNDHVITMADVTTFAANWRKENVLTWMQGGVAQSLAVGDLVSRSMGDFNFDGRINLSDWAILNTANPAMAAAAMQLIRGVPEPSSLALAAVTLALGERRRRRGVRSRRKSSSDLRTS